MQELTPEILSFNEYHDLKTHDGRPIILALKQTKYAETRLHDIRTSNSGTLPELLSVFLCACQELNYALGIIGNEIQFLKHSLDLTRSETLINKVPQVLEAMKQRSSEDVRNALIEMDSDYKNIRTLTDALDASFANLKDRRKVIESALYACQEIAKITKTYTPVPGNSGYDYGMAPIEAGSVIESRRS